MKNCKKCNKQAKIAGHGLCHKCYRQLAKQEKLCTKCNKTYTGFTCDCSKKINFNVLDDIDNSMVVLMVEKFIMNQLEPVDAFVIADLHNQIFGSLTMDYNSLPIDKQIEQMIKDFIKYLNQIKQLAQIYKCKLLFTNVNYLLTNIN